MPWLIAAGALIVFALVFSFIIFSMAFYNSKKKDVTHKVLTGPDYDPFHNEMLDLIDDALKIPYEEVYIKSYDGLTLYGRLYLRDKNAPFHIQFNGYKGNGIRDFSGGLRLALSTGANVLLTDQRAHGKSGGHIISFGVKERRDVLSWAEYVVEKYGNDTKIFLEGVSMGAATVLMASDLDLPENVCGIVADCPYSTPFGIVSKVADEILKIRYISYPFIFAGALLFGRFNIFSKTAVKSVRNTKVPILLIHGTTDSYVPFAMGQKIYEQNREMITLVPVEGAPHGLSYLKDTDLYTRSFKEFTVKCLSRRKNR